MNAGLLTVAECPDNLLLRSHLEQFGSMSVSPSTSVTGDDNIAVRQNLSPTGILQPVTWQIIIGESPDNSSGIIEVDDPIAVSTTDQRVTVPVPDCSKWPLSLIHI